MTILFTSLQLKPSYRQETRLLDVEIQDPAPRLSRRLYIFNIGAASPSSQKAIGNSSRS